MPCPALAGLHAVRLKADTTYKWKALSIFDIQIDDERQAACRQHELAWMRLNIPSATHVANR